MLFKGNWKCREPGSRRHEAGSKRREAGNKRR